MSSPRLRIAIDARPASHPQPGGFKTYTRNLIEGLGKVDGNRTIDLYLDRACGDVLPPGDARFRAHVVRARPAAIGPVVREQVSLPSALSVNRPDVLHCPTGTGAVWAPCPTIVTIHDAMEQMPASVTGAASRTSGLKRRLFRLYNRYCQQVAARRASLVITVSECSRRDIIAFFGLPPEKVRVIPNAPGPHFRRDASGGSEPRAQHGLYIMALAAADPRKNLVNLIRAYARLPVDLIERYRLLLVWTHGALRDELLTLARTLGVADRIASVRAPSDDELCQLYNAASVFAFPSLYEGFGLPPLEAMACGAPVVASNSSSIPEVLGDAALLVDPRSPTELAHAIAAVLGDDARAEQLRRRGIAQAARYTWERTAQLTIAAYGHAARHPHGRGCPRVATTA
jgi:glycosyltransferase involved in cell wall biosynthesis